MKTRPRVRWGRLIMMVVGAALFLMGLMAVTVFGVIQASFRYAPPSAEELREDPSLARYIDPDDQIVETYKK